MATSLPAGGAAVGLCVEAPLEAGEADVVLALGGHRLEHQVLGDGGQGGHEGDVVHVVLVAAGEDEGGAAGGGGAGDARHRRPVQPLLRDLHPEVPAHADLHAGDGPEVVGGHLGAGLVPAGAGEALPPVPGPALLRPRRQLLPRHLAAPAHDVVIVLALRAEPLVIIAQPGLETSSGNGARNEGKCRNVDPPARPGSCRCRRGGRRRSTRRT